MYYDARDEYSLGQLIPIAIALAIAFGIAKSIAFFGFVRNKNVNKWAVFFASLTGVAYSIYMIPHIAVKNELLALMAPLVFAICGGFISWLFFYFAFASVAKEDSE